MFLFALVMAFYHCNKKVTNMKSNTISHYKNELRESCRRVGGKITGARGVKDTARKHKESTNLGSQGLTETEPTIRKPVWH